MTTGPDAGWYDDGHGKQRWWDGTRWTEQFIDLREHDVELRTGALSASGAAAAGWYDDGRGRQRWWDGSRWTDAARFSGSEEAFAGIVVDGRWIHFGALSEPVAGAIASHESGDEFLRRGRLGKPATARSLYGAWGQITPRVLPKAVNPHANYLLVEVAGQHWLAQVPPGEDARARQFTSWINSVSQHYRYR
ncbi:DUF2510 domain-containing protein [Microbacterium pygmaeum]|uniref:DUF2510 domain-containing protein n=1 Tax=Microbacterium pygmaeum TaxID=370764 RepID=A0A1G7ZZF1_9MICO|nr:DUF2510 domain-containing protein [Microbacterium pygmaeum]SDH13947.1 Protein of unknown function [Microbacterium pygmaeum]